MLPHYRFGILLLFFLTFSSWFAFAAQDQDSDAVPRPVDVILLTDNSESMGETDPDMLRRSAAEFLLDFLLANSEIFDLNYQVGGAAFNDQVGDVRALGLLSEDSDLSSLFSALPFGDTDFRQPLDYAARELQGVYGQARNQAVVLFTDGQATLGEDEDPGPYYGELGERISRLEERGVDVFVIGIGDADLDRERWQDILPAGHYQSISSIDGLYTIYADMLNEITGVYGSQTIALDDGLRLNEVVEPYLENLVIAAIKEDPAVELSIAPPGSNPPALSRGGGDTLYEIYNIETPTAGPWVIEASGGDATLYMTRRFPSARMTVSPEVRGFDLNFAPPIRVTVNSLSNQLLQAGNDNDLRLDLVVRRDDDGEEWDFEMEQREDGYSFVFDSKLVPEIGVYQLELSASIDDVEFLINTPPTQLEIVPVPKIGTVAVNGESSSTIEPTFDVEPGEPLEVQVHIENRDLLTDDSTFIYQWADSGERGELNDNGVDGDEVEGDGIFSATISPRQEMGEDSLFLTLDGISIDGVRFSEFAIPKVITAVPPLPPPAPTVTATTAVPTIAATVTVTPEGGVGSGAVDDIAAQPEQPSFPLPSILGIVGIISLGVVLSVLYARRNRDDEPEDPDVKATAGEALEDLDEKLAVTDEALARKDIPESEDSMAELWTSSAHNRIKSGKIQQETITERLLKLRSLCAEAEKPEEFFEYVAKEIRGAKSDQQQQTLYIEDVAVVLTDTSNQPLSIGELYTQLFARGVPAVPMLRALAREDTHKNRKMFFNALATASQRPDHVNLDEVSSKGRSLGDPEGMALAKLYTYLNGFYFDLSYPTKNEQFDRAYKELKENGPDVLRELLDAIVESFVPLAEMESQNGDIGSVSDSLKEMKVVLELDNHKELPETSILRERTKVWSQVDEKQRALLQQSGSGVTIRNESKVLLEVRPSLDPLEVEEKFKSQQWDVLELPIITYDIGAAGIRWVRISVALPERTIDNKREVSALDEIWSDHISLLNEWSTGPVMAKVKASYKYSYYALHDTKRTIANTADSNEAIRQIALDTKALYRTRQTFNNPYVVDGPLASNDLAQLGVTVENAHELYAQLVDPHANVSYVSVSGLRRSGKTTTLLRLQQLLNDPGEHQEYLAVLFDLKSWAIDTIDRPDAIRVYYFRVHLLDAIRAGVQQARPANIELLEKIDEAADQLKDNGAVSESRHILVSVARFVKEELGLRLLLMLDEADVLSLAGTDTLYTQLKLLVRQGSVVCVAHDSIDEPWQRELQDSIGSEMSEQDTGWRHVVHTDLATREEVTALLRKSDLVFTDLAVDAVWIYTGGYQSLVQFLCHNLIKNRIDNASEPQKEVSQLVTVDDVKDIVYHHSSIDLRMFSYLENSFSLREFILLAIIAGEFTHPRTGIIDDLRYGDARWSNTNRLVETIKQRYEDLFDDPEQATYGYLDHYLKTVKIFEQIVVDGDRLPYVRWRVGWLQVYFGYLDPNAIQDVYNRVVEPEQEPTI